MPLPKYPCAKCSKECFKNTNCLRCHECSQWNHRECTSLTKKELQNTDSYLCSKRCETKVLPFNTVNAKDFKHIYHDAGYNLKHGYKHSERNCPPNEKSKNSPNHTANTALSRTCSPKCEVINPNHVPSILNFNDMKNLSFFHGNVASVNKNLDRIGELFQNCDIFPNIIGVTETKLKINSDSIDIEGYDFVGCPTATEAGGAGIFISNSFDYSVRDDLSLRYDKCEDVWIQINSNSKHNAQNMNKIVVGVVYRHPGGNFNLFRDKICKNIDDFNKKGVRFVIMGDVNVNLLKYNVAGTVTNYLNAIQSAGCLSFIDKPTRVCQKGSRWESSCVDHVYSNLDPDNVSTYVIESNISDHFSCLTKVRGLSMQKISKVNIFRRKQRLSDDEVVKLNSDLLCAFQGNSAYRSQNSVNDIGSYIAKTYQNLRDKYMPEKKLSRKETSFFLKPWLNTKGIRTSIKTRNILLGKSKRLKTEEANQAYKKYDKILNKVKNRSYNNHISKEISHNLENKRKLWKIFDKISNRKKKSKTEIKHLLVDGREISNSQEIANNLNDHFNQIGKKMANDIKKSGKYSPLKHMKKSPIQSLYLHLTSYDEIYKLIKCININKACGPDEISGYLIKITQSTIIPILVGLFNSCMSLGIFPDCFKTAEIIPLHKGGKKEIKTNYRPISLLPQFGKLFEKIISCRILSFINKHNLLMQNQYGFRKHYSTELAVTEVYNKLLQNFEDKKHTCAVFLDLAKAFDSVDHTILIKKLEKIGIRGTALSLLKSYLTGRLHYVKTNNAKSEMKVLNIGVPQGSVLGPLLFLIFINDLPNATKFSVTLFADDTFLSLESNDISHLQSEANSELKKVHEWLITNKLTLNIIKSKFMLLTNRRNVCKDSFKLKLDDMDLERCSSYKYLGVFFDDKLDWSTHIKYLCEKIGKVCRFLSKLRHCADLKIQKMVYFAVVKSHLQYCNIAWGDAAKTIIKPLKAMQNRIIRILTFAPFLSRNIHQFYKLLEVMDLKQIHDFEKGKFMYRLMNKKLPSNFETLRCPTQIVQYNLRSSTNERIPEGLARTNYGCKQIKTSGAKLWNDIPIEIRKSESLNIFINKYKSYINPDLDNNQQSD